MYNIIIYIYLLGVAVASRFNEKIRKMWRGEREAFNILIDKVDSNAKYIWFHAASLGEFEQGRPIMERIKKEHPEYKILLTFFSPSGYEVRKNYDGADIICYLPLDTPSNARRFLSLVQPCMAFFIKYEFWWNYLSILKKRGIPTYSVSSIFREGQIFFRWYGKQYGRVLSCFTKFFVQNETSKDLLASIGLRNVEITGDTRFDRVLQIKEQAKYLNEVWEFSRYESQMKNYDGRHTVVVGSSWEHDEDVYLPYFQENPEWKLIIATHVVSKERIEALRNRLEAMGKSVILYSETQEAKKDPSVLWKDFSSHCANKEGECGMPNYPDVIKGIINKADVLIINCYGLLSSIYQYGHVAYVGGGFGVGIHNVLEAAVWGMPVLFGPNNKRFHEAQGLIKAHGGMEIDSTESLRNIMNKFKNDKEALQTASSAAEEFVKSNAGATDKTLAEIKWKD